MFSLRQKRQTFRQEIRLASQFNKKQEIRLKLFQEYKNQELFIQLQSICAQISKELRQAKNQSIQLNNHFYNQKILQQRSMTVIKKNCNKLIEIAQQSLKCKQKCQEAIHQKIKEIILSIEILNPGTINFQFILVTCQPYLEVIQIILKDKFMIEHQKPEFMRQTHLLDYMIQFFFCLVYEHNKVELQHYFNDSHLVKKYLVIIMNYWVSIDNYFEQNYKQKVKFIIQNILNQLNQRYNLNQESVLETVYNCFTSGDGCGFEELVDNFQIYSKQSSYLFYNQNNPLNPQNRLNFFQDMQTLCVFIKFLNFSDSFFSKNELIFQHLFIVMKQFLSSQIQIKPQLKKQIYKYCIVFASFMPFIQIQLPFIQKIFKQQKINSLELQPKRSQQDQSTQQNNEIIRYFEDKQKLIFLMRLSYQSNDVTYFQLKYPLQSLKKSSPNLWFIQNTKVINTYLCILYNLLVNQKSDTSTIIAIIQDIGIKSLYQLLKSQIVVDLSYFVAKLLTIHPSNGFYHVYKAQLYQLAMKLLSFGFNRIPKEVKKKILFYLIQSNNITMDELFIFMGQGKQSEQILQMLNKMQISDSQYDQGSQQSFENQQDENQVQFTFKNEYVAYDQTEMEI